MIVPTWLSPKLLRGLLVALVVATLIGLGWWVSNVLGDRLRLATQVATLTDQVTALNLEKAIADQRLSDAVRTAQEARKQASEALRKLQDAQTEADIDWKRSRIPDGVRDALQ